jgi:hypothetical protein
LRHHPHTMTITSAAFAEPSGRYRYSALLRSYFKLSSSVGTTTLCHFRPEPRRPFTWPALQLATRHLF